jgi:hypothetical protein
MTFDRMFSFSFPIEPKTIVLYFSMKGMELGHVKRNLREYRAKNLSELLVCTQVILRVIPGETLVEVFLEYTK